jgi:hypothetical protein
MAAPRPPRSWPVRWPRRRAWVDGRRRSCQEKPRRGRGAVSGPQLPVHVLGVQRAGDAEPWCLVPSALDLAAAHGGAALTARCRPAAAIRAPNQRLGMEECRAWTKEPMLRPLQVPLIALSLLRLLQAQADQAWGAGSWGRTSAGTPRTRQASILDLRRRCWRDRTECSQCLVALEAGENIPPPHGLCRNATEEAA